MHVHEGAAKMSVWNPPIDIRDASETATFARPPSIAHRPLSNVHVQVGMNWSKFNDNDELCNSTYKYAVSNCYKDSDCKCFSMFLVFIM